METVSDNLNDTSAERAQRQLDDLRSAVDIRLQALESVLADPNRGESLEGLILDLARVATEEARAASVKACLDAKLEADARVIHARAVAQEAVDQERVTSGELRRALEQAKQRIATLEQDQILQLHRLRGELEGELLRERAAAARLEQGATENATRLEVELATSAELRQLLERERASGVAASQALAAERAAAALLQQDLSAERATAADLRATAERAQDLTAKATREKADAWAAQEALTRDLARERDGAAKLQRLGADLRAQLDAERTSAAELQRTAVQRAADLAAATTDRAQSVANRDELDRELTELRVEATALRTNMEAAGARLEMLDTERLRADRARKDLEARLDALTEERDTLTLQLQTARKAVDRLRTAELASGALPAPTPPPAEATPPPPAPAAIAPARPVTPPTPTETPTDDGWGPVRLAVRYSFREPLAIQINGDSGLLVDLSVAGCQFVSPSAIRPNQSVKVLLPTDGAGIPCSGKVMWARFEAKAAGGSIGYRAGVHFTKPDQAALESFIAASRVPPVQ